MIDVWGDEQSGNCLKVKWVCDYLGLAYRWHAIASGTGATATPAFAALNPARQIPVIRLDDGRTLAQSNAIVLFLAEGSGLVLIDAWQRAKVMEWLFWEQYSHEPVIAVRRALKLFRGVAEADLPPHLLPRGEEALTLMEDQLARTSFLAGETFTAADLCLLPYTGLAPEGGYDLTGLPHLRAWIAACAAELKLPPGIFPALGAGSDS